MSYIVYLENSGEAFFTLDADEAKEEGGQVVFYKDGTVVSRIDTSDVRTYLPNG
ncbi:hypothetical protein [Enterobacter kobei]|uniref:hypothetical protein n=1 Tax=Enterobacter kobei TaxID=208224 RepID=UPI00079465FA|nr:hypothetical protein [Enterobacter kobei]CZW48586.1 Uncharacterised protein [Enterobacter kobei]